MILKKCLKCNISLNTIVKMALFKFIIMAEIMLSDMSDVKHLSTIPPLKNVK